MHKIEDLISEFVFDCSIRKLTKQTIKNYRNHLKMFSVFLVNEEITYIEEVAVVNIKKYLNKQIQNGAKNSYINGIVKVLTAFYKWTVIEGYVAENENPIKKIRYQREEVTLIKTFNDKEVDRMMKVYTGSSYLEIRNRAIMAMLFDTGIRNNELCILETSVIKENYILIWGKGNKERVVPISPVLMKMLLRYERAKKAYFEFRPCEEKYLFLSRTGKKLTVEAVERVVRKAGEEACIRNEIRCSPHTCRHYFAQSQLINGNDIYSVSRLLGHNNIMITKRYIQSMEDENILEKGLVNSPLMNLKRT